MLKMGLMCLAVISGCTGATSGVDIVEAEVAAADPNPWNDVDETRRIPVGDFQVLWELDGCTAVHLA